MVRAQYGVKKAYRSGHDGENTQLCCHSQPFKKTDIVLSRITIPHSCYEVNQMIHRKLSFFFEMNLAAVLAEIAVLFNKGHYDQWRRHKDSVGFTANCRIRMQSSELNHKNKISLQNRQHPPSS
jgi:hypothetical protein